MRSFVSQVFGVEGDAGVVTLEILHNASKEDILPVARGKVQYHSRTPMTDGDFQPYCSYLNGECYSRYEDVELPSDFCRVIKEGETLTAEETLEVMQGVLDYVTNLYMKAFMVAD